MKTTKKAIEWREGPPPRRGAYRVKQASNGKNSGWRYWDGEHWGILLSSRRHCMDVRMDGSALEHVPVAWGRVTAPVVDSKTLRLQSERYALLAAVNAYEAARNALGFAAGTAAMRDAHQLAQHALKLINSTTTL